MRRARRRRRAHEEPGADADLRRRHPAPADLIGSEQGPALGAAIHAAVAAGAYPDMHAAAAAMGKVAATSTVPDADRAAAYDALYAHYARAARPLRPRRRRRHAPRCARHRATEAPVGVTDVSRRRCAASRSARCTPSCPQRARRVDERQRLGPRPGRGPDGHQAERRRLRRPDPGRDGCVRPRGRPSSRATSRPSSDAARTPSSTARCRRSAAWRTRTARTRRRGPSAASRSRA